MNRKIGKMERLRNSIDEIRSEKIDESEIDELCDILNEDISESINKDIDTEEIAASSIVGSRTLNKGQISEAEVPRVH